MDYLREGIGLRAWAQRDPLVEYQREGYDMFGAMMDGIKEESVGNLFNLQVEVQENPIVEEAADGAAAIAPAPAGAHAKPGGPGGAHAKPAPDGNGHTPAAAQPAPGQAARAQQAQPGRSRRSRAAARGQATGAAQAAGSASPQDDGPVVAPGLQRPKRPSQLQYSAPSADGPGQVEQRADKSSSGEPFSRVGRNDMCPCGSGRKYKRCHGDPRNRADG
jgi:preprotein translocase subunit SecA